MNLFGHGVPWIDEAVQARSSTAGIELGTLSPLAKEAAELIRELTGMERVTFANTGLGGDVGRDPRRAHGDRPRLDRRVRRRVPRHVGGSAGQVGRPAGPAALDAGRAPAFPSTSSTR